MVPGRGFILALVALLVACGEDPRTCEELTNTWRDAVEEADRSCVTEDDCLVVGEEGSPCGCGYEPGTAVNRAAFEASGHLNLLGEMWRRGCEPALEGGCDYASVHPECAAGVCVTVEAFTCGGP